MIPLRADDRTRGWPWATLGLIIANAAAFGWTLYLSASWLLVEGPAATALMARWGFIPARLTADPTDPLAWLTMLTALFLHAGWLHIAFNMLYLWVFGRAVEDRLGRWLFLAFYMMCGVAATLTQWWFTKASPVPMIGASGAVAGVLGAYLVLAPRTPIVTVVPIPPVFVEVASVPAWIVILVFFVIQLASAVASLGDPGRGGIAFFAHVGGFVVGVLLALMVAVSGRGRRRLDGGSAR